MPIIEKTIEKAFDVVLDALIGKTVDEIEEILQSNRRCRILTNTFRWFSEFPLAQSEYRSLRYSCVDVTGYGVTEDNLDPTQKSEDLAGIIESAAKASFFSDEEIEWSHLLLLLASYYKQRAQASTKLYEVSNQIQSAQNTIIQEVVDVKNMLEKQEHLKQQIEAKRSYIYSEYIQSKVRQLALNAANSYLQFLTKKEANDYGIQDNAIPLLKDLQSAINNMDNLVKENFLSELVNTYTVPNDGTMQKVNVIIYPLEFLETKLLPEIRTTIDELLIKYQQALPDAQYYLILALEKEFSDNQFFACASLGYTKFAENSILDALDFYKKMLKKTGDVILELGNVCI